jgi:hypothetical protein
VNRSRIARFVSLIGAGALVLSALAVGPVAAKNPDWLITPVRLPVAVAAGNDAGYFVTVKNDGTSTINAARFSATPLATPDATPSYFSGLDWSQGGPEVSCSETGKLVCELGTLEAGDTFTFTIAYSVPSDTTNKFDVLFFLEAATGNVGGKNSSRGDKLEVPVSTTIINNQNFDGGFVRPADDSDTDGGDTTYATTGALGRSNRQTSEVTVSELGVTVNVMDGSLVDTSSIQCSTTALPDCDHGTEWTTLDVPGHDGYIKVTLNVYGGSVDGGVQAGDFKVLHDPDSGATYEITTQCDPPNVQPASGECLTATKVGSNWRIVVWLLNNGSLRGTW